MKIRELVREAHSNAVSKGWWQEDRTYGELIALVHSEVSEALEDYRDGKGYNEVWYEYKVNGNLRISKIFHIDTGTGELILGKPCGIPSELADICIRIFDISGKYDWEQELEVAVLTRWHIEKERESFAESLTGIHHDLSESWIKHRHGNRLSPIRNLAYAILAVIHLCGRYEIDLDKAIAEKMAYNSTRSQRHGGKVI